MVARCRQLEMVPPAVGNSVVFPQMTTITSIKISVFDNNQGIPLNTVRVAPENRNNDSSERSEKNHG